MATAELSVEDMEYLAKCEEQFKDRYTEKDEEFMKVFNRAPSTPPILENWLTENNFGYRNDRRNNRRFHPFDRQGHRNRQGGSDRNHRGYNDYNNYNRTSY